MKSSVRLFVFVGTWCALLTLLLATARAQERQVLETHVSAPADAKWISRMPASQRLNLALTLPLHNLEQLHILLQQLEDPTSPNYHRYLTSAQFTEQFGPSVVEYQQVIGFAQSHGLTVTHTSASRRLLDVTGSVANIEQAFQVTMQVYQHPTEKRTYYAPNVEPTADSGIPMLGVAGLTDRVLRHPASLHPAPAGGARPDATGSGPGSLFLGSDIRAAYYGTGPLAGGGQALALAEGQWNFSDVQAYYKSVGQTLNVPIVNEILAGQNPNCIGLPPSCDDGEEVIDMEQILSMAPNASVLIIYEGVSEVDQFDAYATDNIAKVMSYSFGIGDGNAATDEQYFQQFHAQGQNFFVASGDAGDFNGDGGWPGFSQNVTDVGGTDLVTNGAGGPWQSETGWIGSGGGWCDSSNVNSPCYQSPYDATPTYQAPVITSTNGGSTLYRNVPDVAAEANTDNFFCGNGSCGGIGGTSLAAPRFAGFVALVNEQAAANGETIGFLNPLVYTLGQGANYSTAFHDITSGNNNGFNAVAGYDLVTGWGTPNGPGLIDALAPTGGTSPYFTLAATPTTLTVTPGGASQTATISLTAGNSFSGTVNLTASVLGAPPGITASVSPTSITGAATSTLTVAADSSTNSSSFVAGNVEVVVVGTSSGGIQTQPAFLTLGVPSFALSATPSGIYLNQASTATSTIAVTPENGFNGSVTLSSVTGLPSGVTGGFSPNNITSATPSTLTLTATSTAATGPTSGLNVIGASGNISQYTPATSLSVSAATGTGGSGTPINLGSAYNLPGLYADGITFGTGMDGAGYGYSSNLLTPNRVFNGVQFNFGPANTANCGTAPACTNDVVSAAGQVVTLPSGQFTTLQLLATAIDGPLLSESIIVTYSDSTTSTFTQGFSDWCSCSGSKPGPGHQPGESFAVVMPYRDGANGAADDRIFNLYAYTFVLNSAKTVQSLTLPASSKGGAVIVLAATLSAQSLGTPVSLASEYNVAGLFNNGITFPTDDGMDGPSPQDNCSGGKACDDAYSATVLGLPATNPPTLTIKGTTFNFGPVNTTDCAASGTTCINDVISLPSTAMTITPTAGQYSGMTMLGTGVQGSHLGTITVNYTTGSPDTINQTFSDWCSFGSNTNETVAAGPFERINSDGTLNTDSSSCNLYAYTYTLDSTRTLSDIQLVNADAPKTAYAYVAAITLTGNTSSTPGYSLSADATTTPSSVNAGSPATATVTVTPANGYTGSVTLSCSISPVVTGAGAPTCSFGSTSPVSITGATVVTATVTFTTVGATGNTAVFRRAARAGNDGVPPPPSPTTPRGLHPLYASWILVPGLALIGLGFSSRGSRRKKLLGFSLIWIISAGLIILPACGGGSNSGGGGGCSTAPSVPTGLVPSNTTSSGTTLTWNASTAGSGCSVTGYTVYQNGNPIATTANTTFNVTGLTAGTQYSFSVAASDSAGASAQSSAISVTTLSNGTPSGTYTITITGKDANGVTQTGSAPTVTAIVN